MKRPWVLVLAGLLVVGLGVAVYALTHPLDRTPIQHLPIQVVAGLSTPEPGRCGGPGRVVNLKPTDPAARFRESSRKMGGRFPTWLPNGFYFNGVGTFSPAIPLHFARWTSVECAEIQLSETGQRGEDRWKLTADYACTQEKRNFRCLIHETSGLRLYTLNVTPEDALRVARSVRRFT